MRSNYWSCSPFANIIRGAPKPGALSAEGWGHWKRKAKIARPFRFWLAETGLDSIQSFINFPTDCLYAIKYYINNRWVSRTHSLTAHPRDICPGNWCDVGSRFLPCLFNELVDFVEIEQAWSHIAWGEKADRAKYNAPFWATGWFRWRVWRSPQAGLDHLNWAMSLKLDDDWVEKDNPDYGKPTSQAIRAQEIKELYTWWTVTYRNRPDAYDESGWTKYCEATRAENGGDLWGSLGADKTPELKEMSNRSHTLLEEIKAAYEAEDTEMLIRLIKIRDGLWT